MCIVFTFSIGEGRAHYELLNPLPSPKSRSAVYGYGRPWPFTLLIEGVLSYTRGYIPESAVQRENHVNREFCLSAPENRV